RRLARGGADRTDLGGDRGDLADHRHVGRAAQGDRGGERLDDGQGAGHIRDRVVGCAAVRDVDRISARQAGRGRRGRQGRLSGQDRGRLAVDEPGGGEGQGGDCAAGEHGLIVGGQGERGRGDLGGQSGRRGEDIVARGGARERQPGDRDGFGSADVRFREV